MTTIRKQLFLLQQNFFPILYFQFWHKLFGLLILFPFLDYFLNFSFYPIQIEYLDLSLFFEQFHFIPFLLGFKLILIWLYIEYYVIRFLYTTPSIYLRDIFNQGFKSFILQFFNIHQFLPFSLYTMMYIFIYWIIILFKPSISVFIYHNELFYLSRFIILGLFFIFLLSTLILFPIHERKKERTFHKNRFMHKLSLFTMSISFIILYNLCFYLIELIITIILYYHLSFFSYGELLSLRMTINALNAIFLLILIPLFISSLINVSYCYKPMYKFERYHSHFFSLGILSFAFAVIFLASYLSFQTKPYRQELFQVSLSSNTSMISLSDIYYLESSSLSIDEVNRIAEETHNYSIIVDHRLDVLSLWKTYFPDSLVLLSDTAIELTQYIDGYFVPIEDLSNTLVTENIYTRSFNQAYPIQKALALDISGILSNNILLAQAQQYHEEGNLFLYLFNFLNS